MKIEGKYADALVFAKEIEDGAKKQIEMLLRQDFIEGSKIRIMPDVHEGMGCVIGFTGEMGDKVIPNIVGVDIGCGMLTVELKDMEIDYNKLDKIIRDKIPAGNETHEKKLVDYPSLLDIHIYRDLKNTKRIERSIGSLGGGNHFIEVGEDEDKNKYLVIHSGSRNLGKQVAEHYQDLAVELCSGKEEYFERREKIIVEYKEEGRRKEIKKALKELEAEYRHLKPSIPNNLCYLQGKYRERYLDDMKIAQDYASLNRKTMAEIILGELKNQTLEDFTYFETIHNYIDFEDNIVRKGAVSARAGEKLLIPLNMRDGSILARGLGNDQWNNSAPHGAGRLMSRKEAKEVCSMEDFKNSMKDVFSTSVNISTLDESPMAYKPMEDIVDNIGETVDIIGIIKPLYNFKA